MLHIFPRRVLSALILLVLIVMSIPGFAIGFVWSLLRSGITLGVDTVERIIEWGAKQFAPRSE
jgi:hypothetical protein